MEESKINTDRTRICIHSAANMLGIKPSRLMWHPTFNHRDYTVSISVIKREKGEK